MIRSRFLLLLILQLVLYARSEPRLSTQKIVFQTDYGDIEMALFPEVRILSVFSPDCELQIAPLTVAHISKLVALGCYNTNHFFRVHKGFVAQVADCRHDRIFPLNAEQLVTETQHFTRH